MHTLWLSCTKTETVKYMSHTQYSLLCLCTHTHKHTKLMDKWLLTPSRYTHTHTRAPYTHTHYTYHWKRMSQQLAWSSGQCDRWRAGWSSASECWPRCSLPTHRAGGTGPPPAVGSACLLSDARGSVCSGCHQRGRLWSLSGRWPSLLCPSPWYGWPVGLDPGRSGYRPGFLLKVLINQSYSQKLPGEKKNAVQSNLQITSHCRKWN